MIKKRQVFIPIFLCFIFLLTNLTNCFAADTNNIERIIEITSENSILDSFYGVEALYRMGSSNQDNSNPIYSCAAYVKKYYNHVYGITVYNLFAGRTPLSMTGEKFVQVKKPKTGDIVYTKNHWAIVKSVNDVSNTITLIEQNFKWVEENSTFGRVNRTIPINSAIYYRCKKLKPIIELTNQTDSAITSTDPTIPNTDPATINTDPTILNTEEIVPSDSVIESEDTIQLPVIS